MLSLAMICKDDADVLERCLESIIPHVDEFIFVDNGSKDDSVKIAKKFGAKVYTSAIVDNFSALRNFSFSKCTQEWILWSDCDDIFFNFEKIKPFLEKVPEHVSAVIMPYFYAFDDRGNCISIHNKERIIRRSRGMFWLNRVHECVNVIGKEEYLIMDLENPGDPRVEHHKVTVASSFARNIRLLLMQHVDEPTNVRTMFYLGNEYWHQRKWAEALYWYEKVLESSEMDIEKWQSFTSIGHCFHQMGDFGSAINANLKAIEVSPGWADAYLNLGRIYLDMHDWPRSIYWTEEGLTKAKPTQLLQLNPLDYNYWPFYFVHQAYREMGMVDKAFEVMLKAHAINPQDQLLNTQKLYYETTVKFRNKANGFLAMTEDEPEEYVENLDIPPALLLFPQVRERKYGSILKKRKRNIAIWCGNSLEQWGDKTLDDQGMGGSETAVIYIARYLSDMGYSVDVFNMCGKYEGLVNSNLGYWRAEWFNPKDPYDLVISWRQPALASIKDCGAKKKVMWCHDLHYKDQITKETAAFFDYFIPVSNWHAGYLKKVYDFLPKRKMFPIENGINVELFKDTQEKNWNRWVYSSSPDRGLDTLIGIFKEVQQHIPEIELRVYYGWENTDKVVQMGNMNLAIYKQKLMEDIGKSQNIFWEGRIKQSALADELLKSGCFYYPTLFLEVGFIAGYEAQAAGMRIITSKIGNLPDNIGDRGLLVPGHSQSPAYQKMFVSAILGAHLQHEMFKEKFCDKAREYALAHYGWEHAADKWKQLIEGIASEAVA